MKKNEQGMQHIWEEERCIQSFGGETGGKEITCKT